MDDGQSQQKEKSDYQSVARNSIEVSTLAVGGLSNVLFVCEMTEKKTAVAAAAAAAAADVLRPALLS
jgi:hypothetical protein